MGLVVVGPGGAKPPGSRGAESGRWRTSGKRPAVGPAMVRGVEVPGGGDGACRHCGAGGVAGREPTCAVTRAAERHASEVRQVFTDQK